MFCTNCGKEIEQGAKFCTVCGTKVESVEKVEQKAQSEIITEQVQQAAQEVVANTSEGSNENTGTVIVKFQRQTGFIGCAVSIKVYVDRNLVATLRDGESKQIELPFGEHSVIIDVWSAASESVLNLTSKYPKINVIIGVQMGVIKNKADIMNIKDEQGNSCMSEIRMNKGTLSSESTPLINEDGTPQKSKMDKQALIGFIIALVGIFKFNLICGFVAICLGIASRARLKVMKNAKGKGFATAAIVIGIIEVILVVLKLIVILLDI